VGGTRLVSHPDDAGRAGPPPLPADLRPFDDTPVHTADLPPTPIRDRNVPAEAWVEAPEALLRSADDLAPPGGEPPRIAYKRRLGDWLLWRAGPAKGADARYVAVLAGDLDVTVTFRLFPDGTGTGTGADGATHDRFRSWKQSLLAAS
jgi:hypothetical protein